MAEDTNTPHSLDALQKRLYSREGITPFQESSLVKQTPKKGERWMTPAPPPAIPKKKISGAVLFFGIALGFFLIAGGIAGVMLFLGGRSVSNDHVRISLEGNPTSIPGGEPATFFISIINENPVPITHPVLSLQFPPGTMQAEDTTKVETQYSEILDTIPAGGSVRRTVRAAFFGTENQAVSIPVRLEYRTENSNAVLVQQAAYGFRLTTAPVSISVTSLSEVTSGQPVTLLVTVRSNATTPLSNVAVRLDDMPFGFTLKSITPDAAGTMVSLGTLLPGEEREVRITGTVSGQEGDVRVFRFTTGTLKNPAARDLAITYSASEARIAITKPFLNVGLSLNREDAPTVVVKGGDTISGLLSWNNPLQTPILDGTISITLSGNAFNTNAVNVTNGLYRSADKTIEFNGDTMPGLKNARPGDSGNGMLTLQTNETATGSTLRNPTGTLTVSVSGRRIGERNVPETVTSTVVRTVQIQTDLSVASRLVRAVGPFSNTGPLPPQANVESTYTVLLSASNTVNSVANAVATMKLPSYVRFTSQVTPQGAITYNEVIREVTWNIGDMPPGGSKEGAFQIALLPSVSQKGTSPIVLFLQTITGTDRFVKKQVTGTAPALTSDVRTDPSAKNNSHTVQ